MNFDVTLTIAYDGTDEELTILAGTLKNAPFPAELSVEGPGVITIHCQKVPAAGIAALPESLRKTQAGLSPLFRQSVAAAAARGGLLWGDVLAADVRRAE
jgi:hypothetical protein